jgi:hypothetical protein
MDSLNVFGFDLAGGGGAVKALFPIVAAFGSHYQDLLSLFLRLELYGMLATQHQLFFAFKYIIMNKCPCFP